MRVWQCPGHVRNARLRLQYARACLSAATTVSVPDSDSLVCRYAEKTPAKDLDGPNDFVVTLRRRSGA